MDSGDVPRSAKLEAAAALAAGRDCLAVRPSGAGKSAFYQIVAVALAGPCVVVSPLAVAGAARNLVLLGDSQQLAQPSHATHPPGAGTSALEHMLLAGLTTALPPPGETRPPAPAQHPAS